MDRGGEGSPAERSSNGNVDRKCEVPVSLLFITGDEIVAIGGKVWDLLYSLHFRISCSQFSFSNTIIDVDEKSRLRDLMTETSCALYYLEKGPINLLCVRDEVTMVCGLYGMSSLLRFAMTRACCHQRYPLHNIGEMLYCDAGSSVSCSLSVSARSFFHFASLNHLSAQFLARWSYEGPEVDLPISYGL